MTIKRADWIFLFAVLLVVLLVSLLPSPRDRNPSIPADQDHRTVTSEKICSTCHAAGQSKPLGERHPKRQDCFRCHRQAQAARGSSQPSALSVQRPSSDPFAWKREGGWGLIAGS